MSRPSIFVDFAEKNGNLERVDISFSRKSFGRTMTVAVAEEVILDTVRTIMQNSNMTELVISYDGPNAVSHALRRLRPAFADA